MQPRRSFLFDRWPRIASHHPWLVMLGAFAVFAAVFFASTAFGGKANDNFQVPGLEAQKLDELMKERFTQRVGGTATVVIHSPDGLDSPATRSRVTALLAALGTLPEVTGVSDPYADKTITEDRRYGHLSVQYGGDGSKVSRATLDALAAVRAEYATDGLQVEIGGDMGVLVEKEPADNTTMIALIAAVIILIIAFGSIVAMGVPVVTALLGTVAGIFLMTVMSGFVDVPQFGSKLGMMIGLGVGIDYALLIVTRFREGLARNLSVEDAIVHSSGTAGRSVLFAGITVVIALTGLWAIQIPAFGYAGTGAAMVVACSVVVAVGVMPAMLRLLGPRINKWHVPGVPAVKAETTSGTGYRWSRAIQRHPLVATIGAAALLLTLSAPVLWMDLGSSDDGNSSTATTARRAYDLISDGFGPGLNGPILVGFRIDDASAIPAIEETQRRLTTLNGVASVEPVAYNAGQTAAVISVIPTTSPQAKETEALVDAIRDAARASIAGSDAAVLIGGSTAAEVDVSNFISKRMPLFLGGVIGLSFLLLMMVFRSVIVPIKAAIMNLLSIGVAYGVIVAIFQWGWLAEYVGVTQEGPIEFFLPMLLFAVLFGLSMDYEVFLISRIKEEYDEHGDNAEAVARGLSATSRLITAAATIMVSVFVSFAFGPDRIIKELGIGLAVAVFIDATVVRMILVPASMHLMGRANWWMPRWLDRILPRITVEAPAHGSPAHPEPVARGGGVPDQVMASRLNR